MIRRPCTTPHKQAYTTRDEAELRRVEDGIRYGTALYPYQCVCGQWHLSRNTDQNLPAYERPDPANVTRIRTLDAAQFAALVDADAKNTIGIPDKLALRHPDNLTRWHWALKTLHGKVSRQLAEARTFSDPNWRQRAEIYRNKIETRLAECQRLRTQATHTRAA
ncbi:hypothetical protein [Streptomyces cylindrosporus]|uniref:Uncharacterized protein n=1 Tax=Streptomyces cylindrosporus TaxID=2927583 RepID=A0ABS9YPV3_9ACTN|nr:hypothetical protein [Streptomyces cylindrosporus]MCI3279165.1 hypothetical protein [Streptomyces cylindrosporus]